MISLDVGGEMVDNQEMTSKQGMKAYFMILIFLIGMVFGSYFIMRILS